MYATHVPILLLLVQLWIASGMQTRDMCAIFQEEVTDNSLTLVTPGYLENENYKNASFCECTIMPLEFTSHSRSLNLTIQDIQLETCTTSSTEYDTLKVRAAYAFEDLYREFTLCGDVLPLSNYIRLSDNRRRRYGVESTIFSMGTFRLQFQTDGDIEDRGVKLVVTSHTGIRISCVGVSGAIYTTPPTTEEPTTTYVDNSNRWQKNLEDAKKATIRTAAIVGTFAALFAIGVAILVFYLIKKHKANEFLKPPSTNGVRRESDGRPIYRDPGQGRPDLPIPDSMQADCNDEYLYMKGGLTTPVYENPHANGSRIAYVNEESGGNSNSVEEHYHNGYIIPGTIGVASNDGSAVTEKAPVVKGLVLTKNKPPIAAPKHGKKKPHVPFKGHKKLQGADSNTSTNSDDLLLSNTAPPVPVKQHNSEQVADNAPTLTDSKSNDSIYEPPLVKPSDMRKKAKLDGKPPAMPLKPKPVIKSNFDLADATAQKPVVTVKPNLRNRGQLPPPPTPPNKPGKLGAKAKISQPSDDSYQVVSVETSIR